MTNWKALPDTLEPDVRRLVEELRRSKDAAGISLAALAAATSYSKSSWERYLNGAQLPPADAVRALAVRAGTDPARLLTLWELAESAWRGRGRTAEPDRGRAAAEPALADEETSGSSEGGSERPDGAPAVRRRNRRAATAAGVLAAVVVCAVVILGVARDDASRQDDAAVTGSETPQSPARGAEARCHGSTCDGEDAVEQGCGGDAWTAAMTRVKESYVEVRYSSLCRTAWARIKWATPGDRVELVRDDGRTYDEVVPDDANLAAFTFMLGAPSPQQAKACWELTSGEKGCTDPGGSTPLPEPSPVPS
ncbi:DUF2690 domain-containing protein [Streptomyces sp. NPDC058653]|uniref:DUF2690 domain-containing protein n=1 Tax=Streptomyces sp. NPDC058653 TaxID=3346576 RepID=UPI0036639DA1